MTAQHTTRLHVNDLFLIEEAERISGGDSRVLDYGCGAGALVEAARQRGLEAYGTDPYFARPTSRESASDLGLLGSVIREMTDGKIPFGDSQFRAVVSNQVFEHVDDLDLAINEIDRVLEPGGWVIALFPSRSVVREGHVGIPMAHWFPDESRSRYLYVLGLRSLGLGYNTEGKSRRVWARDVADYLDVHTVYRSRRRIIERFSQSFELSWLERSYIEFRLRASPRLQRLAPLTRVPGSGPIGTWALRRLFGMVLAGQKPG